MGNVSFSDRFELLELLRDGQVQTFRARERATGRAVEAHFFVSPDSLAETQRKSAIDQGSHEGKFYLVTAPSAESAPLDSAGAWRIKPSAQPAPAALPEPGAAAGDFTRMFHLRQAPEPVAAPVAKPVATPATTSQPGEFTRAFQRPAMAPSAAPTGSPAPGEMGEFTRMFQQPAKGVPAAPHPPVPDQSVPAPPAPASQPRGVLIIVIAVAVLCAIAVFIFMRRLY
jgi:hypothetical protein